MTDLKRYELKMDALIIKRNLDIGIRVYFELLELRKEALDSVAWTQLTVRIVEIATENRKNDSMYQHKQRILTGDDIFEYKTFTNKIGAECKKLIGIKKQVL